MTKKRTAKTAAFLLKAEDPVETAPLSKQYLLLRGVCCGNGCRHCPYSYKNVPEPKRTLLLSSRSAAPFFEIDKWKEVDSI